MKVKAYVLTFCGIVALYMLRMGYNYSKRYFKTHFHFSTFFVSLMDSSIYFGIGFGFIFRYLLVSDTHSLEYSRRMAVFLSIFFSLLPLSTQFTFLNKNDLETVLLVCLFFFGLFQFYFFPCYQKIINRHYNNDENQFSKSIWNGSCQFGKIIGFSIMSWAGQYQDFHWQTALLLFIIVKVIISQAIYWSLKEPKQQQRQQQNKLQNGSFLQKNSIKSSEQDSITWSQYLQQVASALSNYHIVLYLLLVCCYRSIYINFLLWLSDFMFHHNYAELGNQISLIFISTIVLGSFVVGKMYEYKLERGQQYNILMLFLISISVISFLGFWALMYWELTYFNFVGVMMMEGMAIGGLLKIMMLCSNLVLDVNQRRSEMIQTFVRGVSYVCAGLVDLAIGGVMNFRQNQKLKNAHYAVIEVLFLVQIFSIVVMAIWIYCLGRHRLKAAGIGC